MPAAYVVAASAFDVVGAWPVMGTVGARGAAAATTAGGRCRRARDAASTPMATTAAEATTNRSVDRRLRAAGPGAASQTVGARLAAMGGMLTDDAGRRSRAARSSRAVAKRAAGSFARQRSMIVSNAG